MLLFSAEILFKVWRYRNCNKTSFIIHSLKSFLTDLKRCRAIQDDLRRVLEGPAGFVLSFRSDHLVIIIAVVIVVIMLLLWITLARAFLAASASAAMAL